jgi:hypothetical protein
MTLTIVLIIIVGIIAAILIIAAMKPNSFRVERSIEINAKPEKIFPFINDYHKWTQWSPYENLDPNLKRTYSGAIEGKGSIYEYSGNSKAGEGRMEITEVSNLRKINMTIDFIRPMKTHNFLEFTFKGNDNSTNVTWAMYGSNGLIGKVFTMFVNMDNLVGKDFEKGLASLKNIAEKP